MTRTGEAADVAEDTQTDRDPEDSAGRYCSTPSLCLGSTTRGLGKEQLETTKTKTQERRTSPEMAAAVSETTLEEPKAEGVSLFKSPKVPSRDETEAPPPSDAEPEEQERGATASAVSRVQAWAVIHVVPWGQGWKNWDPSIQQHVAARCINMTDDSEGGHPAARKLEK